MIEIKDEHIKKLEKEIVDFYNEFNCDYNKGRRMVENRKMMLR